MRIGFIVLAGKPVHKGHWSLLTRAAEENDAVMVLTSQSSRDWVTAQTMHEIWVHVLVKYMPQNAQLQFAKNPLRKVWELIGEIDKGSDDSVGLYVGADDLNRYSSKNLQKYVPTLWSTGRVDVIPVERSLTGGISGTRMRQYIVDGEMKRFISGLPDVLSTEDKLFVWHSLQSDHEASTSNT